MTRTRHPTGLACFTVLTLAVWGTVLPAHAADDKKAARTQQERVARLQQAQQALEAEKGQLVVEKAEVSRQLESTRSELDKAKASARQQAGLGKEVSALRTEKEALEARVLQAQAELAQTQQQLQAAAAADSQARKTLAVSQRDLEQRTKALGACTTQNEGLYKLNTDLLERYEKSSQSGAASLLRGGWLTQLHQVRLENEGTQVRDQLDDMRVSAPVKPQ